MLKLTSTNIEFTELNLFSWHFKWFSINFWKKITKCTCEQHHYYSDTFLTAMTLAGFLCSKED